MLIVADFFAVPAYCLDIGFEADRATFVLVLRVALVTELLDLFPCDTTDLFVVLLTGFLAELVYCFDAGFTADLLETLVDVLRLAMVLVLVDCLF